MSRFSCRRSRKVEIYRKREANTDKVKSQRLQNRVEEVHITEQTIDRR